MKNKGKLLNKNIWLVCLPGFLLPLQAKVVVEGKSGDQPNMEIIEVYAQKRAQKN
jgi:iron complex outermembrane receptor protein